MNHPSFRKSPRRICPKCGTLTPHYDRANGKKTICLFCTTEWPIRQSALRVESAKKAVEVVPLTHGKPEEA